MAAAHAQLTSIIGPWKWLRHPLVHIRGQRVRDEISPAASA
jgi:hypothetical protein